MTLKQIFIKNLKEFRKKGGLSQMQLAEYCGLSIGYIAEIETGKKFPSVGVIEKIAAVFRIEPYLLFKNNTKNSSNQKFSAEIVEKPIHLPYYINKKLQKQLKTHIKKQSNQFISQILAELTEIVSKY
jgi:transcriptional regulator with XRE-family HTH domain